jgi:hypothetical protein
MVKVKTLTTGLKIFQAVTELKELAASKSGYLM